MSIDAFDFSVFKPFHYSVWILFFVCICAFGIFLRFTLGYEGERVRNVCSLLLSLGAFCQQGAHGQITMLSTHAVICCMLLSSLLFYNYYSSTLVSMIVEEKHDTSIKTFEDLMESNLPIRFLDALTTGYFLRVLLSIIISLNDSHLIFPFCRQLLEKILKVC